MIIVGVLVLVLIAASWIALMNKPRLQYTPAAVFCGPLYDAARNAIDTSEVDATLAVTQRTEGATNPLRCGDLRRANLLTDSAAR